MLGVLRIEAVTLPRAAVEVGEGVFFGGEDPGLTRNTTLKTTATSRTGTAISTGSRKKTIVCSSESS